jgi:hypothetical protein
VVARQHAACCGTGPIGNDQRSALAVIGQEPQSQRQCGEESRETDAGSVVVSGIADSAPNLLANPNAGSYAKPDASDDSNPDAWLDSNTNACRDSNTNACHDSNADASPHTNTDANTGSHATANLELATTRLGLFRT